MARLRLSSTMRPNEGIIEVYGYTLFEKSDDFSPMARAILAPEKLLAVPKIRAETNLGSLDICPIGWGSITQSVV